jgi:hypothetical protein
MYINIGKKLQKKNNRGANKFHLENWLTLNTRTVRR